MEKFTKLKNWTKSTKMGKNEKIDNVEKWTKLGKIENWGKMEKLTKLKNKIWVQKVEMVSI